MPKSTAEIFLMYCKKCEESDDLRDKLGNALDTIEALESEVDTIKDRTIKILMKIVHFNENLESFPPVEEPLDRWIADIWLRLPENDNLFGKIEESWEENLENPQKALIELNKLKAWEELRDNEWIWCCLLEASIKLHIGESEEAIALLNTALRRCKDYKYNQLRGIAHYIRARIFMIFDKYPTAHWELCQAAGTEGYANRIEESKRIVDRELSRPEKPAASLKQATNSKDLFLNREVPQTSLDDITADLVETTENHSRHQDYTTTKASGNPNPKTGEVTSRIKPRNSLEEALRSFGTAGDVLVSSPTQKAVAKPTSSSHTKPMSSENPYQKSVAEQDYYNLLPPDVQAGMLLDETRAIEKFPSIRGQLLDESLIDRYTLQQLSVGTLEQLLYSRSDIPRRETHRDLQF